MDIAENILGNVQAWDKITQVGIVLLVFQVGSTTHRMVDEEMAFYMENGIDVMGAVSM